MRMLTVDCDTDPVTPEIFLPLQLRAANEPFLPKLKIFQCNGTTTTFIPFIPFFLSPQTTEISFVSTEDSPTMAVASTFTMFATLCPNLERVTIRNPERDLVTIDALSEMLLAFNQDSLQIFHVDSPLSKEAREVVFRLPKLSGLWVVIEGHTLLPPVELPNLTEIDLEYDDHLDWLQGFRGAALGKLESVSFCSQSEQIGDFLGAFESVALTSSVQNTLSSFMFTTSRSWYPNYSSLLSFKQLEKLVIEFTCDDGCSSKVDDDVITTLAQAMPKLEILQLGGMPCKTRTGPTVHGLIALAFHCLHLSELRIHFQGDSLVCAATSAATTFIPIDEPVVPREDCALTDLMVGCIPIPTKSAARVTPVLLQIFPRILNVHYANPEWRTVAQNITEFRRIGAFVHRSSKLHPVTFNIPYRRGLTEDTCRKIIPATVLKLYETPD